MFRLGNTPVMSYVAFAIIVTAIMWETFEQDYVLN